MKTKVMTLLVYALVLIGVWHTGSSAWIYTKVQLAQVLLQRAWAGTLVGQQAVKPWPWADTWPFARLVVPDLGIDQIVLEGAYGRTLAFGPAHVESATGTKEGTIILTGHRDTHFAFLEHVQTGERIVLQSSDGHSQSYRVGDRRIVDSRSGRILLDREHSTLVLVTCYPFRTPILGGPLRLVVTAEKEDTEGEKKERTVGTSGG